MKNIFSLLVCFLILSTGYSQDSLKLKIGTIYTYDAGPITIIGKCPVSIHDTIRIHDTVSAVITVPGNPGKTVSAFTSQFPKASVDNDKVGGHEMGMKFRSSSPGFITGAKFYKMAGMTGTHIGELYDSKGNRLASATFMNESTVGWQSVVFPSPVPITSGTTYVVAYFSQTGAKIEELNYFNASVSNGEITALADGVDGVNGVYAYGSAPVFPSQGYKKDNYWVDVIFSSK